MLPPGQQLAAADRWPVIGERQPKASDAPWTLSIAGLVDRSVSWSLDELRAMPQVTAAIDVHCVTRWSKLGVVWSGVLLEHFLAQATPSPGAEFVSLIARSERRHSTSLRISDAISLNALVALSCEMGSLPESRGGPMRLVLPDRYFYKSLKWLERIEVLEHDRLGYWEATAGYHNSANPWQEERYLASDLDRHEVARLLASGDVAGRELRGFNAADRELPRFNAHGAILRDADFRRARLAESCFAGANLSNARLMDADLRGASLTGADLEGADFVGADLRGADFRGASLVAATLVAEDTEVRPPKAARIDATTRFDRAALDQLMPRQAEFLAQCIGMEH